MIDPSRAIRVTKLSDQGRERDLRDTTPAERIGMIWQLTLDAWAFVEGFDAEAPMQRDVVRVIRRKG
jgi:hypothetical protein